MVMAKTDLSNDILKIIGDDYLNSGDWLIFDSDLGILFIRKSRHRIIEEEDGELSTLCIITPSGESLPHISYALDENFRAS